MTRTVQAKSKPAQAQSAATPLSGGHTPAGHPQGAFPATQGHLAELTAIANQSELVQGQLRLRNELQDASRAAVPRGLSVSAERNKTLETGPLQIAQLILDAKNVEAKAGAFIDHHSQEAGLIRQANTLLNNYSMEPTQENLEKLNKALPQIRDQITIQTNAQADIIAEYAACKVEEVRKTFLDKVLAKDSSEMRPLFDKLLSQTKVGEEVDEKFKFQFLSYVLQSSKFVTGEARVKELMGLLGDRQVVIGARRFGAPLAGLERPEDDPKSQKTDARDKGADQQLLHEKGGNLAEFIKAKRAQGDTRVANPANATIGNVQVDMDSSQQLLPVYFGLTGSKEVHAYTAPLFTAIHHELGHAVNRLKGVHGRKTDRYTPDEGLLSGLTDEEELQNISLDRYSDKAFTDELNLPERIAHGAFTNLDAQEMPFTEQDLKGALETWDKRTYKMDELRSGLLQKIRSVAFKDWTPFTFHGSAPAGVLKIQKALSPLQTSRKGIMGQLNQVQKLALSSHENPSSTRTKTTAKFYHVLATMRFDSPEGLTAAGETLATAWSPFAVQEDPTPGLWTPGEAWRVHESRNDTKKLTEFPRYPTE